MTPLEIANLGLGWLARPRIASFDDATKVAERVKDAFDGLRDAVLEDRDWTFAVSRRLLPRHPVAPEFGYRSRYEVPGDLLRVVTIEDPSDAGLDAFAASLYPVSGGIRWEVEGGFILADTGAAELRTRGIARVTDPTRWSAGFCQALAARLAADLCVPLTENRSLQSDMWALYETKLNAAAANDGRQGRSQRLTASTLKARRFGYGVSGY
jgi:hypothetical protein